ncbi:MAG: hypothetical protein JSU90_13320 [Nitrospiraceae bacterium]|nr:MAG: hypothetical protein JSU90_13320 [Nitrospiraceae bacterium]
MKKATVKTKRASEADIDRFCQSVEEILSSIKDRRRKGRKKKGKAEGLLDVRENILTFSQ